MQQELIHVLCGLCGLRLYRTTEDTDGFTCHGAEYEKLRESAEDFFVDRDNLRDFLRERTLPLPAFWFPDAIDNTEQWLRMFCSQIDWTEIIGLGRLKEELEAFGAMKAKTVDEQRFKDERSRHLWDEFRARCDDFKLNADAYFAPGYHFPVEPRSNEPGGPSGNQGAESSGQGGVIDLSFFRSGDDWCMGTPGNEYRLNHLRGFEYLQYLIRHKECSIPPADVFHQVAPLDDGMEGRWTSRGKQPLMCADGSAEPLPMTVRYSSQRRVDDKAINAVREELKAMQEERPQIHDIDKLEKLDEKIAKLKEYLRAGARKSEMPFRDDEKARITVTKGIKKALQRIEEMAPLVAEYLNQSTIKTGYQCHYSPSPDTKRPIWHLDPQ